MVSACCWRGRPCFGRGRDRGFVLYISIFWRVLGWWVCVCLHTRVHNTNYLGTWCEPRCGTDTWRARRIHFFICLTFSLADTHGIVKYARTYKNPPKWQKTNLVSGGHGQAWSLRGQWAGWIGSAPVQISACGLDGALSWWCDELLLVVVVLRSSVVSRGQAIGVLATKGIPLRIAANREKGRASWCQAGLPAQSLRRHRFRRALRAFICTFCMRVCIYVYVCTCADMYICIYMHVCMYLCVYTHVYVYVYAYLCIDCGSWYQCFSVWTVSCMRICLRVHMHAYMYVCGYIYMCIFLQCVLHALYKCFGH